MGGFITPVPGWNIAGPFDVMMPLALEGKVISQEKYMEFSAATWDDPSLPQQPVDLSATYTGKFGKTVAWQTLAVDNPYGLINFDAIYGDDMAVACAVSYIYTPEDCSIGMLVGSDDGVAVSVGGKEVWRNHVLRGVNLDQDMFDAELLKGWNEVLVKVMDCRGGWGLCFRVFDLDRKLKYALKPEPEVAP
jgi:hypothetical protein